MFSVEILFPHAVEFLSWSLCVQWGFLHFPATFQRHTNQLDFRLQITHRCGSVLALRWPGSIARGFHRSVCWDRFQTLITLKTKDNSHLETAPKTLWWRALAWLLLFHEKLLKMWHFHEQRPSKNLFSVLLNEDRVHETTQCLSECVFVCTVMSAWVFMMHLWNCLTVIHFSCVSFHL